MATSLLSSNQYCRILNVLPFHVFIFSEEGQYLEVFGGEDNQVGFDCKQYIGRFLHEVLPEELSTLFCGYIQDALLQDKAQHVRYCFSQEQLVQLPFESGGYAELWIEAVIKPFLMDDGSRVVIWSARNITEKHYLERQLKEFAETDVLTGSLNRRAFMTSLSIAMAAYKTSKASTAFLMLDIDHFKAVNDIYGHPAGDQVIQHVTRLMQMNLRDTDVLGRLGGEEFAIILHQTDTQQAVNIAERLRQHIEHTPCDIDGEVIAVTVSIGVSQLEASDAHQSKYVLNRSDTAMYHAKRQGRNRVMVYQNSMGLEKR